MEKAPRPTPHTALMELKTESGIFFTFSVEKFVFVEIICTFASIGKK